MSLSIRPLHPVFAAEVTGIDCRRTLDPEIVAAIEQAMDEYAVLVFPEQQLSDLRADRLYPPFWRTRGLQHARAISAGAKTSGLVPASPIFRTSTKPVR